MSVSPILLVEDDPDIQENLRLFLELEGYPVESAFNGQEALDYLRSGRPACVVLLDLMMPIMSGYEFLEQFTGAVPVIVLSASPDLERIAHSRSVGFVRKPIDLDVLLTAIASRYMPASSTG